MYDKNLKMLDELIDGLNTLKHNTDALSKMTDNELEDLLEELQTLNNQLEKTILEL